MKVYDNGHEHCMALVNRHEIAVLDRGVVLLGNRTFFFYQPRQISFIPFYPIPLSDNLKSYYTHLNPVALIRENTSSSLPSITLQCQSI